MESLKARVPGAEVSTDLSYKKGPNMLHTKPERLEGAVELSRHDESFVIAPSAAERMLQRLLGARRAYTTRNIILEEVAALDATSSPHAGDVVLARVESLGHHTRLESPAGRRQTLYCGNEIIVAYGNRYATDQFEATIPSDLGLCDLVAGGGVASLVRSKHRSIKPATKLQPLGLLTRANGQILNLNQFKTIGYVQPNPTCHVILVVGTSMNAGKTTTAASLVHGLTKAGMKVGAAKITGTGSGGDIWSLIDAGARCVADFTDIGHASTSGLPIEQLVLDGQALIHSVTAQNDFAVVEIADGLLQEETAALLGDQRLRALADSVVLAAGDAMGAAYGHQWLTARGIKLAFIAGCVGSSPLGRAEAMRATGLHVATLSELTDAETAPRLCLNEVI